MGSSSPNNGTNWTETAWSCTGAADCAANGGSGGGVSGDAAIFGLTSRRTRAVIQTRRLAAAAQRMVPDISADADPNTGFPIYTSRPERSEPGFTPAGGTSLAAPVSAALFTNALAAHGVTSGAVDVLPALYNGGAANDGSFRDITTGTNGALADAGNVPSVNAGVGYDTVTGLGAPLWPKIVDRSCSTRWGGRPRRPPSH